LKDFFGIGWVRNVLEEQLKIDIRRTQTTLNIYLTFIEQLVIGNTYLKTDELWRKHLAVIQTKLSSQLKSYNNM